MGMAQRVKTYDNKAPLVFAVGKLFSYVVEGSRTGGEPESERVSFTSYRNGGGEVIHRYHLCMLNVVNKTFGSGCKC